MMRIASVTVIVAMLSTVSLAAAGEGRRRTGGGNSRQTSSEIAGGRVDRWKSEYREIKGQKIPQQYPHQQNSKTVSGPNNNEHRFYNPRTGAEGAAFANASRGIRSTLVNPGQVQYRLRP
jgi:hypothetical protein